VRCDERWIFTPRMTKPCSSTLAASSAVASSAFSSGERPMTKASGSGADDLRCVEFVDAVTAYLYGEVSKDQRRRIDHHLEGCQGCQAAFHRFRTVIHLVGHLTPADVASIDPLVRDHLTAIVRAPRRQ
jgi:biotin synthase-related radical SAM superfamily protein